MFASTRCLCKKTLEAHKGLGSINFATKGSFMLEAVKNARSALDFGETVIVLLEQGMCLGGLERAHPEENARASRFQFERDAYAHLAGRRLTRSLLAYPATQGVFEVEPRGKPFVPKSWSFSIAHSGAWVGVAVSPVGDIGLDVEACVAGFQYDDLIPMICSQSEADWIGQEAAALDRFLKVWTRKEALLKRDGVGLTDSLSSVGSAPDAANGAMLLGGRLWSDDLTDRALLAVATVSQCTSLLVFEIARTRRLKSGTALL